MSYNMNNKLKPNITTNIVRTIEIGRFSNSFGLYIGGINIHDRDAKRILQNKVWNSRKIRYDGDSFACVMIVQSGWFDDDCMHWLLQLEDLRNGETRVTPMYEIEVVKHSHRDDRKNYIVFKKKNHLKEIKISIK